MPQAGPTSGETNVMVRSKEFFNGMSLIFPHPKCKFGKRSMIVDALYVPCSQKPLTVMDIERGSDRSENCVQCEQSPATDEAGIVAFTVTLTGDFDDSENSVTFRYYDAPKINAIYPRFGEKDGNTEITVWGENFLDFDYNTRCSIGGKTTRATFISSTQLKCLSPESEVV
jgi:hypothetical protein